jgi:serine phosphatase RsbU (regulator of sigma subunit)
MCPFDIDACDSDEIRERLRLAMKIVEKSPVIAVGTDGIWEARGVDGRMFGKERYKEIIRREAAHPADAILEAVYRELNAFSSGYKAEDDITLVVIKVEA